MACRILLPWQGTEPVPPAVEVEVPMIVKTPGAEDITNKGLLSASKNLPITNAPHCIEISPVHGSHIMKLKQNSNNASESFSTL